MKRIGLITMLLLVMSVFAQGKIDWERGVVSAVGIGAPNLNMPNAAAQRAGAVRAAKLSALRELGETVKGMYISGETKVENFMVTNDEITGQFEGILRAFRQVGPPEYFDDGSVQVTVELSINGDLSALFLENEEFGETEEENTTSYDNLNEEAEEEIEELGEGVYTGLIVDCRDINLRPALSPKILDESGNEIYGSAYVSREFAVQQGMMGYLKDIEKAKSLSRVGANPLVIRAQKAKGPNKVNIVISDKNAAKIKSLASKLNFLRECRVVAIVK